LKFPTVYLIGLGQHPLGVVVFKQNGTYQGMNGNEG